MPTIEEKALAEVADSVAEVGSPTTEEKLATTEQRGAVSAGGLCGCESFDLTGGAVDPARFAQAFDRVQAALLAHGIHRIHLYLAGDDEPTLQRYLKHGFQISGRHMTRRWEAPPVHPTLS